MKVLNRIEATALLKTGHKLTETTWGGYHYDIDGQTIQFNTARTLIKDLHLNRRVNNQSPLIAYYTYEDK